MENFDDEFGDLFGYKILSFEEISKDFEGNKNPLQGIARKSFEEMSAFKSSPFGQYWEKELPIYAIRDYGSSRVLNETNFSIIDLSKKISSTLVSLYNNSINENWDDIKFIVYANPDGSEILKQYANPDFKPEDNQVLFLIETNDGKFDFGKIVRVKLGKKAIEKLQFQYPFLGQTDEDDLAAEFLNRSFEIKTDSSLEFSEADKERKLNTAELKDLLAKAIQYDYKQKKFDDMSLFLTLLQGQEYIGLNIPKKLLEVSQWMRTKKYEEEKFWNALLEKDFAPAFLPNVIVPNNRKSIKESIINKFKQQIDSLSETNKNDLIIEKIFKEILNNVLLYLFDKFSSLLDEGLQQLDELLPESEMLNEIYSLNAFLVGLWNGCIEFVAGIVDLVSLAMIIARDGIGFALTDSLGEAFENLLNEIVYNFEDFIKKLWGKFHIAIKEFSNWYLKYGTNQYYWYKFLGELTPDILTFLVPALKAGKAGKISKAGSGIAKETTEEILNKTAKELSEKLEQKTAQQEIKKSFEKAETELEERIPKENYIEEVVVGGASKKLSSIWKVNLKEGKYNCANCVIATDATLAGRPASALPYTIQKRFRKGKWENYASFEDGTEFLVLEKEFNAKFSKWTVNLDDLIRDLKPSKRGIIFGVKKGKNMGHYFNVINENGVVKFLDGQTGKRAKLVYDYYQFLPTN
ncbi:toxin glutamine deamidase domain-containing protein [Chryseobacterium aquaticum]|uniref:toxin glutamine deamidase domain-containing protein n=1 Tax=Chryseobacterium aquaticum TaxID=452084 RepID=UPI002FC810B7